MISRLFLSICIASLLSFMYSNVNGAEINKGVAKLSGQLTDGTSVEAVVQTVKLTSQYPYKGALIWGGDVRGSGNVQMPKSVISLIDLRIGNEKVFIPLSAYSDLGNPMQASLEKAGHGFKITITGGDTATSYKAVLIFDNEHIQRRRVSLGEFPDEVWEETVYSFISKKSTR